MVLGAGPRRLVVTGAGGFIGAAVIPALVTRGYAVCGLVRDRAPRLADVELRVIGDLTPLNQSAFSQMLQGADAVLHLAARVHLPSRGDATEAFRAMNVDVTQRLARAAAVAGVRHFIFASSIKVNGEVTAAGAPFRESDVPQPHDAYARSKAQAEAVLADVARETGMRVTALRLPLTYGPGATANFAALARAIRRGVPLPLEGIANRRSLLGTDNLSSALATVLDNDDAQAKGHFAVYLVADAASVSTPQLARAIGAAVGVPARLFSLPPALLRAMASALGREEALARLTNSLEADTRAFRERFAWTPPRTLQEGLASALAPPSPL